MKISLVMDVVLLYNIMINIYWDLFLNLKFHNTSRKKKSLKRWMQVIRIQC